jgi:hypothetical protein
MAKALPFLLKVRKELPEFSDVHYHIGSIYGRMGQKGLSHFYFGRYFKLRGEKSNALTHFRKAAELLEKGSPEREEVQREIKELAGTKEPNPGRSSSNRDQNLKLVPAMQYD